MIRRFIRAVRRREPYFYAKNLEVSYCDRGCVAEIARPPISLIWWISRNFGDLLSPLIVKVLSGRAVRSGNLNRGLGGRVEMLALGTILSRARDHDIIWGTGFNPIDERNFSTRSLNVRAVRGPLTRQFLLKKGINCPEIYGDPAILMPYLFRPQIEKKYDVGIISHFADCFNYKKFKRNGVGLVSSLGHPLSVIKKICECSLILSSSLHGIIIAEAYGIPACWLSPDGSFWLKEEVSEKYLDYYSSTRREPKPYCFREEDFDLDLAVKMAKECPLPVIDPNALLRAFPFLRPDIKDISDLVRYRLSEAVYKVSCVDYLSIYWDLMKSSACRVFLYSQNASRF